MAPLGPAFAALLLVAGCAAAGGVTPLPPQAPYVAGAPPLAFMAEYRRNFALRGAGPNWTATLRPGQLRLRVAGEPDAIVRLALPEPCAVVGCDGAWFDTEGARRTAILEKRPCALAPGGPTYPYVATVFTGEGAARRRLVGCAAPGTSPAPGRTVVRTAADPPPSAPAMTAEEARDAFDRELAGRLSEEPSRIAPRPWHETAWLRWGTPGAVGRLHDLCTGMVEPKPALSIGPWSWETIDPRTLGPADREALLAWRGQVLAAAFGCGTVFQIGTLGHDAMTAAGPCPEGRRWPSPTDTFVAYVARHPESRTGDDLLAVAVAALQDAGCG
ncbi:hypothetical protein [Phenylobacterium sp.]|uniref:hypothetical protein n=1 Tax=Phenylobacterium sp. TaxID=1871053 RepID=UPI0035B37AC3